MKQSPRHTCCINTLRSIEENVCRGPLTAKTNKYTKAPYIPPCSPLLLLKTETISWKNSLIWGNGVPTICRLLQTPKSHPRRKRKESSPKVITGYRGPGDHTGAGTEAPDVFREPRRPIPSTWEGQCLKQAPCVLWGCSCEQGDVAPWVEGHAQQRCF